MYFRKNLSCQSTDVIGMYGTGYLANSYTYELSYLSSPFVFLFFFLSLNRCRSFVQSNLSKLLLVLFAINISMNL